MSTKGKTFPPEPLTTSEVDALLSKCSLRAPTGIRDRALIVLLYRSGLRITEALELKPSDVSFGDHSVRVLHGKGDKATVRGFHASADDSLMRWIETRKGLGIRGGTLFCTLSGGKLSDRQVRDMLKRRASNAGIDKRVHPHAFRHTFADELRRQGVDVVTIQKLLGHTSVAITARYLDHLTNDQAVKALQAVDLPELGRN